MNRVLLLAAAMIAVPVIANASPYRPVYGSPNSVQSIQIDSSLDLSTPQDETDGRFDDGDADTIGAAYTRWDSPMVGGDRYEVRYQKAMRPFEGSRTRLVIDTPLTVLSTEGETAVLGVISAGLEVPVTPNWSLTPRVAYGFASASNYYGGGGELVSGSITSRYRFAQVGRGDLVIGNMLGYTSSVDTGLVHTLFKQDNKNWTLRNGVAYQWPMKMQIMGRQASARVSFSHTEIGGDFVNFTHYDEAAISFGVRGRESTLKNKFEALRIGLIYTFCDDYKAGTLTLGYRF